LTTVAPLHGAGVPATGKPVLEVRDLRVHYDTDVGQVPAVDGASFSLQSGERLALVGESGSGKTTLAMALLRLTRPPGRIVSGEVLLNGQDLLKLDDKEMRGVRLSGIALVQQGAMNSMNPVVRVREQLLDGLYDHGIKLTKVEARERVAQLLTGVGLTPEVADMFPHELSGGMKQRVCIATATSLGPKVIVADEPTSALDVVVQRQVMVTLGRLQAGLHAAVVLVGHDMGLVAQFADTIGVMYAGKLVEVAPVAQIFGRPLHPYTKLLIESLPTLDHKQEKFVGIPGLPPALLDLPPGCVFHPRCPSVMEHCRGLAPGLREEQSRRWVACHLFPGEQVRNA